MPITVEATQYTDIEEGQYDIVLSAIELQPEGKFGPSLKLVWQLPEVVNDDGKPYEKWDFVSTKWGNAQKPSALRTRVYALAGGKLTKYVDAVLSLEATAIDLEWFLNSAVLGELKDVTGEDGTTRRKFTSFMALRDNADKQRAAFLQHMLTSAPDVHQRAAAIAGLPLGPGKAPAKAATAQPQQWTPESDGEEVPF